MNKTKVKLLLKKIERIQEDSIDCEMFLLDYLEDLKTKEERDKEVKETMKIFNGLEINLAEEWGFNKKNGKKAYKRNTEKT